MSESDSKANTQIIRDPKLVKNRIFVGNLPTCTREELESICHPYGKVLGSLVQKNFGFVQFESEEIANKVASALTRSTFKGHTITVRNAGAKAAQQQAAAKRAAEKGGGAGGAGTKRGNNPVGGGTGNAIGNVGQASNLIPGGSQNTDPNYNDCEIIVVDRRNTKYAEFIEERLKRINLRVDVLFPNEDVALGKVLSNISSRGCLYAVLITNQHEEHNSITVNILYGQPAEHRNMPVEDAIQLISDDFRAKLAREGGGAPQQIGGGVGMNHHLPNAVPIIPVAPPLQDGHPDAIQMLLNLLADNLPLTVLQYDRIIKYLQELRELQLKVELGDAAAELANRAPDPEIEVQKRLLSILNKPSVAETRYELLYPSLQSVKEDYHLMELLKDVRVQKALDSLMDSKLVATVENHMKF